MKQFATRSPGGEERVGKLDDDRLPVAEATEEQLPPIGEWIQPTLDRRRPRPTQVKHRSGRQRQRRTATATAKADAQLPDRRPTVAGSRSAAGASASQPRSAVGADRKSLDDKHTDRYGIVVFSHLRWGFVWQRPQQFLSRFAKKHQILFIEEPFFDLRRRRRAAI